MLPRQRLRVVSLILPLVLTCEFLIQTIGHLKFCAAEHQSQLEKVVRRGVVIERRKIARTATDVVEVPDRRRVKIAMRGLSGKRREPAELGDVPAEGRGRIAGHEASDVAGDLTRDRHVESRFCIHVYDRPEWATELSGNAAGQHFDVRSRSRIE